jgi:hypothetical protein
VRNVDTITDFSSGVDKIHSSTPAAQDANDRILSDQSTGLLSYDADDTGALAAMRFAVLGGQRCCCCKRICWWRDCGALPALLTILVEPVNTNTLAAHGKFVRFLSRHSRAGGNPDASV